MTVTDAPPRRHLPETIESARTWDRIRNAYATAGLCTADAAAAAWGHAEGWTRVTHAPCVACAPIVATFPEDTAHGFWRKHPRGRAETASAGSTASGGAARSTELATTFTGALTAWRVFGAVSTSACARAEVSR